MKRFIILLTAVLAFSVASIAQTKVYAEIVGDSDTGISIKVDFGKNSQKYAYMTKGKDGKKMYFGSMVDAMNQLLHYLRSKGNIIYDNRKRVWKYVSSSF